MPRKTNAVFEKAKRIADKERRARGDSIRWCSNLLIQAAELCREIDRVAVFTEDNVEAPDRVQNLMQAQADIRHLIDTLALLGTDKAAKDAASIMEPRT